MKKERIIFCCSGAADVGELADKAARRLSREGCGSLLCLAAIGADRDAYLRRAKEAGMNIAIDGCPVACARETLARIGVKARSLILTELGFEKGGTPPDTDSLERVCAKIRPLID